MAPIPTPIPRAPKVPTQVHDYTVLPLLLPPTASYPSQTSHYLYLRAHAPRVTTPDTSREVFAVNLPIDATEQHLRALFAEGLPGGARIEDVEFEGARTGAGRKVTAPVAAGGGAVGQQGKKRKRGGSAAVVATAAEEALGELPEVWEREVRRSGSTAVLRFVDQASAEVALREARRAARGRKAVEWGVGVEGKVGELGRARYTTHHQLRYPSAHTLQQSVDTFMTLFAEQEASRARALARQRAEPDEDGFITVVRGGRAGPARLEEAQEKAEKQKEKNKGKEDFYRFQMREKRKERAGELLRGFEEDRRRVEDMKRGRNKFRPN